MKTSLAATLLTAILILASISPAAGANHFTLSLGSGLLFLSDTYPDGNLIAGVKGGYWLVGKGPRETLGLEGTFLAGSGPDLYMIRIDALYPLFRKGDWSSFLTLGLGGFATGSEQEPIAAGGVVVAYQSNSPVFTRIDIRHLREIGVDEENGWEIGLNVGYTFGYKRKPKPAPPADTDGDGVPDRADRCPGTPKELTVDRSGCPIDPPDADLDGVPDYLDKCPGTGRGDQVTSDGCPPDADGDGVPDAVDRCPNTPPGLPIAEDGCVQVGGARLRRP